MDSLNSKHMLLTSTILRIVTLMMQHVILKDSFLMRMIVKVILAQTTMMKKMMTAIFQEKMKKDHLRMTMPVMMKKSMQRN